MKKLKLPSQFEVAAEDLTKPELLPVNLQSEHEDWDWITHVDGKPKLYFNELLKLCSSILKAPLTEKYAPTMFVPEGLKFEEKTVELKEHGWSGAKRVNVASGEYTDISDPFTAIVTGQEQTFTPRKTEEGQFFMHGKDDSCLVEGSWYDWLCLVGNILGSDTVRVNYPELYQPQLKNDNY